MRKIRSLKNEKTLFQVKRKLFFNFLSLSFSFKMMIRLLPIREIQNIFRLDSNYLCAIIGLILE